MPDVDPAGTDTGTTDTGTDDTGSSDEQLGDAGVKALQAWKDRAKAAEAKAKTADTATARAAELEAELAAIRASTMTDDEKAREAAAAERDAAIAAARDEAAAAVRSEVLADRFADKVQAVVAGRLKDADLLSDPVVAQKLLGLDTIPVDDTGKIDAGAISAAVDEFLVNRPHLATGATPPAPLAQGSRGAPAGTEGRATSLAEAAARRFEAQQKRTTKRSA